MTGGTDPTAGSQRGVFRPEDCANAETTLGAPGLTLAALSFLPTVLTPEQVAEVFRQGTLLSNTGYSIKYTQAPGVLGGDLGMSGAAVVGLGGGTPQQSRTTILSTKRHT